MSRRPPWRRVVRCLPPFRTGIVTPHSRPGKRPRHTGHYWETETEAVSARNRKFESTSLQRRVRCEPIFPPGPKAGPKTRGGAHEPLTQIKQFLSAAHHLLSK